MLFQKNEYLHDFNFLKEIDTLHNKSLLCKVTLLDWNENILQDVVAHVINGNVNIDGSSAIRRTANLTIYASEHEIAITKVNSMFSLNKKIYLEVGVKNTTNKYKEYETLWFPLGLFIISSASSSNSNSGVNITLQLKDKMCLLNGECGGVIPTATTFDKVDVFDNDGNIVTTKVPIYNIIQEAVNHFGGEPLDKIFINDLDVIARQVVKLDNSSKPLNINGVTLEPGKDVGYIITDFVYPGDGKNGLLLNAGQSVCDLLNKITSVLGNYEYFYDIYGNFRFQEKKNYLNTTYGTDVLKSFPQENYGYNIAGGKAVYDFSDGEIVLSYNNNPQYNMIKNDFIIWGKKESANGTKTPICYHLAIDEKPEIGNEYLLYKFYDENDKIYKAKFPIKVSVLPKSGYPGLVYLSGGILYTWSGNGTYKKIGTEKDCVNVKTDDWRTELYIQSVISEGNGAYSNEYSAELNNYWYQIYDIWKSEYILEDFSNALYFLDIIDNVGVDEYNIKNIGKRTQVVNDDKINCLFAPAIPDIVYIAEDAANIEQLINYCDRNSYKYEIISAAQFNKLIVGGHFNSAFDYMRELLYQYTNYNESISIQTLPIYYIEPNNCIKVRDSQSDIYGNYIIKTISIPLGGDGNMTITANRALDKI